MTCVSASSPDGTHAIPLGHRIALLAAPHIADDSNRPYLVSDAWAYQVDGENPFHAWLSNNQTWERREALWKEECDRREKSKNRKGAGKGADGAKGDAQDGAGKGAGGVKGGAQDGAN